MGILDGMNEEPDQSSHFPDEFISLKSMLIQLKDFRPSGQYRNIAKRIIEEYKRLANKPSFYSYTGEVLNKVFFVVTGAPRVAPRFEAGGVDTSPKAITFQSVLNTVVRDNNLENKQLETFGFKRTEISEAFEFEFQSDIEELPDYKAMYFALQAKMDSLQPPPSSGEIYAIKREEILIVVIAYLHQHQKNNKNLKALTVTELLDMLEQNTSTFWTEDERLPMSRKSAADLIGFAMHLLDRPVQEQNLIKHRIEKKQKRKNSDKERVIKGLL